MRDLEFNYLIMNDYDCLTVLINIYISYNTAKQSYSFIIKQLYRQNTKLRGAFEAN